jgi:hypothetical protein
MPVYKNAGALMNENVLKKALGSLKFGDIALKQFEELQMGDITLITPSNEYLNLHVANGSANFFKHSEPTEQKIIPPAEQLSEKEIEKLIEKKLKSLGISLANYGKAELLSSDAFTVAFAYPWMLNGYSIWDISDRPDFSPVVDWKIRPINMNIYYDRTTREIALYNVNIAKYTYANYPTLPKEEILKDFTVGIEKLNAPEIVYLMKTIDRESYYIP